jgi:hypothetical protein
MNLYFSKTCLKTLTKQINETKGRLGGIKCSAAVYFPPSFTGAWDFLL